MKILRTRDEVKSFYKSLVDDKLSIGFVPTMGALHQGHLDLVSKAKESTDAVVVSIFVNPTQFNNKEDFDNYPKTLDNDLELLNNIGVHGVFIPDNQEVYANRPTLTLDFGPLERVLEGAFRPGHFNGVGIVVSKLLNIVKPHKAFFGQKDLQQVAVIKTLVRDLSFDVQIVVVPTVRDQDGLALSSRNLRLDSTNREKALILYKSLSFAKAELWKGRDWLEIRANVETEFSRLSDVNLEYFELVNAELMEPMDILRDDIPQSICVAAFVGEVRLIDNISVNH
ncbi:pantoate--beta-alanine ligase [Cecembia lonarensis]|uniref:Pantothenate synthetase n=1 Tax=Cecembia lonarensis (strain CCUG 58316 / KCTC 22772 / LW9) TaxID=1225176 RepID=K1LC09_CECL9|nr:pantoate--beta-alanine ligase [Cecembia lonarensis]EKB47888.1 Pantothenate synthetase [Cecembia lonarensis LW9]